MAISYNYPTKQNSPEASTTSTTLVGATTIAVDHCEYFVPEGLAYTDVSASAPVLAVIGYDNVDFAYPETVKITAISAASGGGNLTVARAIGSDGTIGIAREWASGTNIAIVLTSQHVDVIQSNQNTLQSQIDFINTLNSPIIGVQWDTTSTNPVLTRIDVAGNALGSMATADFDKHILFGGRWRCVRNRTTGAITYGTNARGDGLTLDGTAGDVLVRKPIVYVKTDYGVAGAGIARYWISPRPAAGFVVHPAWMQRNNGIASPVIYSGAYESYGYLQGSTFMIGSASGKIPITGGVAYPNLPNTGRFNISDAETYANNITGTIRSGCENVWNNCATQLLMYIEFGTLDIQTALGKGVVDLDSGTGFAGKNTGADSIDSRLAENGTGTGSGTNGQTPICWRGEENPYGNTYKFVIGANFFLDGSVRVLKRDGTGTIAATLATGSYDTVTGPVALTNGYASAVLHDAVSDILFLGSSVAGGGSGYFLCDYWTAPTADGNILLAGGYWDYALAAGPSYRNTYNSPAASNRYVSARLEFYPEGGSA